LTITPQKRDLQNQKKGELWGRGEEEGVCLKKARKARK